MASSGMIGRFYEGFAAPFRAVGFVNRQRRLLLYVLIPFLINLAVFSLLIYLGFDFFGEIVGQYIPQGDAWYWRALAHLLRFMALLLTVVLVFFSFTAVGNLIAAPFNDILCQKTSHILAVGRAETASDLRAVVRDAWRATVDEGRKIGIFVAGMALLLFINLIPGVGVFLYPPLSLFWTVVFLAVEYTGYVFAVRSLSFKEQRSFILTHKLLMFGFGSGLLLLLAIPFLQFFCIPFGVVAATRLCYENGLLTALEG